MTDKKVVWVKYCWELRGREFAAPSRLDYGFRHASPSEAAQCVELANAAYASDPIWAPMMASIRRRMTERVRDTFGKKDCAYLLATRNGAPIALSGLAVEHWTQQNFLTGICVVPGHQRQGVGTCLLAHSLAWLRDAGVAAASVFTEQGSVADRKIYCRFGSERTVGVVYPDPPTLDQ